MLKVFPNSRETHALLYQLDVFHTNAHSSRTSEVPCCLEWKILNHDPSKSYQFSLEGRKDSVIGQVKAVRDFSGDEIEVFVSRKLISSSREVAFVYRIEPFLSPGSILWTGIPIFPTNISIQYETRYENHQP